MDIENTLKELSRLFPGNVLDILDCLGLLNLSIEELLDKVANSITEEAKERNYKAASDNISLSSNLSEFQKQIETIIAALQNNDEITIEEETMNQHCKKTEITNYSDYVVDSTVPHTLLENFTHKKVCAFSLVGSKFEVKDWRDVLVQTCEFLAEKDKNLFLTMIDDPAMQGKKNPLFGFKYIKGRNTKMRNLDVYVWVHASANQIASNIRKILKKYNIKITDFQVFFRADYAELHIAEVEPQKSLETEDKIGVHVRTIMRKLSDDNHIFSVNEIQALESKEWCKNNIGVDYPILKPVIEGEPLKNQIKVGNYLRYWKEMFVFNGKKYLITSQWFEKHKSKFDKWYSCITE